MEVYLACSTMNINTGFVEFFFLVGGDGGGEGKGGSECVGWEMEWVGVWGWLEGGCMGHGGMSGGGGGGHVIRVPLPR